MTGTKRIGLRPGIRKGPSVQARAQKGTASSKVEISAEYRRGFYGDDDAVRVVVCHNNVASSGCFCPTGVCRSTLVVLHQGSLFVHLDHARGGAEQRKKASSVVLHKLQEAPLRDDGCVVLVLSIPRRNRKGRSERRAFNLKGVLPGLLIPFKKVQLRGGKLQPKETPSSPS